MYILVLHPLPSPTGREGGMLNVLFKTIEKSIAYPHAWVQSLYPETRQAWSFLKSLKLPHRLRACFIISTPGQERVLYKTGFINRVLPRLQV